MTAQIEAWENRLLAMALAPLEDRLRHEGAVLANRAQHEEAYQYCRQVTREHSRTFFIASSLLPREQRRAIAALYAFCRVSDDLIDRETDDRERKFEVWRQHIMNNQTLDDDKVAMAWADTRARYHIPLQYTEQLLDGIASDSIPARYETFEELAQYCYAVASTVGLMSAHIIGYQGQEAIPYAVKLGVALQLTNILRDVAEDWRNGRLYLPQLELAAFGLTAADLARWVENPGPIDDRWHAFMRFQIARARQLYAEALPGVAMLGTSGRFAVGAAAELYRGILDDIEAHDYDVFTRRAHTRDMKKLTMLPGIWWRHRRPDA